MRKEVKMKKSKHGNYHKIVAFVLIAIVIVSAVGFVVNGWQPIIDSGADSGNTDNKPSGEADNKNNGDNKDDVPVVVAPKYYNYLTGLEVSEEDSRRKPLSFIVNPILPLFGVSSSPLSIEFPTENGGTRLLVYSYNATELGKIGALQPTRGYISNMLKHFGGSLVALGDDDIIEYDQIDVSGQLIDLTKASGYYYTEPEHAFSNGDLLRAAISAYGIATELSGIQRLPFTFTDVNETRIKFEDKRSSVLLPYSGESDTRLVFDTEARKYSYLKAEAVKIDMLNASDVKYDNVFVLFADSVTHETVEGTELIIKTVGSGSGYYLTEGTYTTIKWLSDGDTLTFYDENDNKLVVNRGSSYIGFVKSTAADSVILK